MEHQSEGHRYASYTADNKAEHKHHGTVDDFNFQREYALKSKQGSMNTVPVSSVYTPKATHVNDDTGSNRASEHSRRGTGSHIDDNAETARLRDELLCLERELAQSHREAMEARGRIKGLENDANAMNISFRSFRERSVLETEV